MNGSPGIWLTLLFAPVQAGEGRIHDESPEARARDQFNDYFAGNAYMIAFLFSTGAGPVDESIAPYHGREKSPEIWIAAREPEKWIENYLLMNRGNNVPLPPGIQDGPEDETDDDLRAEAAESLWMIHGIKYPKRRKRK